MGKAKHGSKPVKTSERASKAKAGQAASSWKPWSLADCGLRVETVKADGNCFFRAVAAQLEVELPEVSKLFLTSIEAGISPRCGRIALQGASGDHMSYRQSTVSFMRQHKDDFEPFMEDEEDFERYCSRMAQVSSSCLMSVGPAVFAASTS